MEDLTPEEIAALIGKENLQKFYDDTISESAKEVGGILTDIAKTFRLFMTPFQYGAVYQDRLSKHLQKIREEVPDEDQIQCSPQIAGPVFENLKYIDDSNYLSKLYLNLLKRAIDRKRINEAHPAFVTIINQLSPDEALLIKLIATCQSNVIFEYEKETIVEVGAIPKEKFITHRNINLEKLAFPDNIELYLNHLKYLNILEVPEYFVGDPNKAKGGQPAKAVRVMHLSKFGKMFYTACVQ